MTGQKWYKNIVIVQQNTDNTAVMKVPQYLSPVYMRMSTDTTLNSQR